MSSVVARRIIATPARHASEAWAKVVSLVAPDAGEARTELLSVGGIASSLISDEAWKNAPAVMRGNGPRVRFYCLYDDDAISGEDANEDSLASNPTEGDWKMSLPCFSEDLEWVQAALKKKSSHITARDLTEPVSDDESENQTKDSAEAIVINREAFLRS